MTNNDTFLNIHLNLLIRPRGRKYSRDEIFLSFLAVPCIQRIIYHHHLNLYVLIFEQLKQCSLHWNHFNDLRKRKKANLICLFCQICRNSIKRVYEKVYNQSSTQLLRYHLLLSYLTNISQLVSCGFGQKGRHIFSVQNLYSNFLVWSFRSFVWVSWYQRIL